MILGCCAQTLPPLRYLTADEEVTNERVRRHLDELYWFKPTRPPSRYLHLNCVLRTHAHAEFERSFPHALFTRHHLERALRGGAHPFGELLAPRLAVDRVTSPSTIAEPLFGLDAPATEAEHSVLQYCIGNMLKCARYIGRDTDLEQLELLALHCTGVSCRRRTCGSVC